MAGIIDRLLGRLAARIAPRVADRLVGELERHVGAQLLPRLDRRVDERAEAVIAETFLRHARETLAAEFAGHIAEAAGGLMRGEAAAKPLVGSELYLPTAVAAGPQPGGYMTASVPLTRDFLQPEFAEFAEVYGLPFVLHRKHWEWAFIHHTLQRLGMLQQGRRGLGFGVGCEWMPALFARAGVQVTATDTPSDDQNWRDSNQYGGSKEHLFAPHLISRELFEERVAFEPCDMTRIPPHLSGYDFCWSSCCFEHLGNLQRGLDFVVDSVERTLVVGGIACHTTELNLSSDEETIETGRDVIYRKRDLLQLCRLLEERGHAVEPLRIETGGLLPDFLVDVPPYRVNPHLKLRIGNFVATSLGLVIRRGR